MWVLGTGKKVTKVTPFHELFLTVPSLYGRFLVLSRAQCACRDGMEPYAKTPPMPLLSPEITATQATSLSFG